MQIIKQALSDSEVASILEAIIACHPEASTTNSYNENVDASLQYLRYLPFNYTDVAGECIDFVLLSSVNGEDDYGGRLWHKDGSCDETTVLLYLQGDSESGGEFCTEESVNKFEVGTMFVLNSADLHKVNQYNNKLSRIALKWKFR